MASPFPGMDPYLEKRNLWRSFHQSFAVETMAQLNSKLSPRYFADVEVHTVLDELNVSSSSSYPDVSVLEVAPIAIADGFVAAIPSAPMLRPALVPNLTRLRSVLVYETDGRRLVTSIEILSPVNKRGDGFEAYRQKRRRVLLSDVHLIEIDLLRSGQRPAWEANDPPLDTDYIVLVNRANTGDVRLSEIWPVALNEVLPAVPVPLLPPDSDVLLNLGVVLTSVYTRAAYAKRIDYTQPPPPPKLRPAMQSWLATHFRPPNGRNLERTA